MQSSVTWWRETSRAILIFTIGFRCSIGRRSDIAVLKSREWPLFGQWYIAGISYMCFPETEILLATIAL